jgi:hypothetical protein
MKIYREKKLKLSSHCICKFHNFDRKTIMGSTGTGRLTDYSDNQKSKKEGQSFEPQETGGRSGNDKCLRAFSTNLEEVASSPYLNQNGDLPPKGTKIVIVFDKRLMAVTEAGVSLGYLPTPFNYLLNCIENGFSYSGIIVSSNLNPLPSIAIDVHPQ